MQSCRPSPNPRVAAASRSAVVPRSDPAQEQAICATDHRLAVLGGPGHGKTLTVAQRVAHLCDQRRIDPQRILVIAGSPLLAGRLRLAIQPLSRRARPVRVSTADDLALMMLAATRSPGRSRTPWQILPITDLPGLLAKARIPYDDDLPAVAGWPGRRPADARDLARQIAWALARYIPAATSRGDDGLGLPTWFASTATALRRRRTMLAPAVIPTAWQALMRDPALQRHWEGQFDHVLIDDVPLLTPAAFRFLVRVTGTADQMLAYDPCQGFWSGSGVWGPLLEQGAADPYTIIRLGTDWRCPAAIRQGASLASPIAADTPTTRIASRIRRRIHCVSYADDHDEIWGNVAMAIRRQQQGGSWDEIAILCPTATLVHRHRRHADGAGIPHAAQPRPGGGLVIMPLADAVGLEFPAVIIPGWDRGLIPNLSCQDEDPPDLLHDSPGLLAMAMTRARRSLVLTRAGHRHAGPCWMDNGSAPPLHPEPLLATQPNALWERLRPCATYLAGIDSERALLC